MLPYDHPVILSDAQAVRDRAPQRIPFRFRNRSLEVPRYLLQCLTNLPVLSHVRRRRAAGRRCGVPFGRILLPPT